MASLVPSNNYAFTTCQIKVNTRSPGWQRTVRNVLSNIQGVSACKMDQNGVIQVSGIVSPELLIKKISKAGRKAELQWIQFGQCSSNLDAPVPPEVRSNSADPYNAYYDDFYGGYNHGGYYAGPEHGGYSYRPFAGLARELHQQQQLQRRRANFGLRQTVYVPRNVYRGGAPGCCSLM